MAEIFNINQTVKPKFRLIKLLLKLQKFTLVLGVFLVIAVLLGGYQFILRPQYNQIILRKQELQSQGLEQQIADLETYLLKLNEFIALTATISAEDIKRLDELLAEQPDPLTYSLEMQTLFTEYGLEFAGVNFGEPVLVTTLGGSVDNQAATVVDQSVSFAGLFAGQSAPDTTLVKADNSRFSEIAVSLKYLPIDFSVNKVNYFTFKDLLIDLEQRLPLVDISQLSLSMEVPAEGSSDPALITANFNVSGKVYFIDTEKTN